MAARLQKRIRGNNELVERRSRGLIRANAGSSIDPFGDPSTRPLSFRFGGLAIFGGEAVDFIAATTERQLLGDIWAGTWVVRRLPATPPTTVAAPSPPSPPATPPGAGRSG